MLPACLICKNSENNKIHNAREMMFGTRDRFDYLECSFCGTVQITEIPDLQKYYPREYYSLDEAAKIEFIDSLKKRIAVRFAGKYFVYGKSAFGKYVSDRKSWVHDLFPASMKEPLLELSWNSKILDFGCGTGKLLRILYYFGFRDLTGADAFIADNIRHPENINILKKPLSAINDCFDLIMLHHSFEHFADPVESLEQLFRLVKPGKFSLIRIPVVSETWTRYGVNWVQLDPPRHLFLYTEKAFVSLAERAGFSVEKIVYDSTEFQFWASEYYAKDIAMNEPEWFNGNFDESIFTAKQFENWKREAEIMNEEKRGDQACFYLRRPS